MYINEAIRRCDNYCPNEYEMSEKYAWCDDLSAMLTQEHDRRYETVRLERGEDGTYLLPEGITFEMVDMVRCRGRELKKYDWRSFGIKFLYGARCGFMLPEHGRGCGDIDVVYIKQHTPIRDTVIKGYITFNNRGFYFKDGLCEGDFVEVNVKEAEGSEKKTAEIQSVEMTDKGMFFANVGDAFNGWNFIDDETVPDSEIKRVVTEETVCPPPYDLMYVDYLMAQVCFYQRDFATYNRHMTNFNQRLAAFDMWLQKRRVQEKDNKIVNWW